MAAHTIPSHRTLGEKWEMGEIEAAGMADAEIVDSPLLVARHQSESGAKPNTSHSGTWKSVSLAGLAWPPLYPGHHLVTSPRSETGRGHEECFVHVPCPVSSVSSGSVTHSLNDAT